MGNLTNQVKQIILRVSKNSEEINEKTLIPIFEVDLDFKENESDEQDEAIALGYSNIAEKISKEIFDECMLIETIHTEEELLNEMIERVFKVEGFIGQCDYYGDYVWDVIYTEFEMIVVISYVN